MRPIIIFATVTSLMQTATEAGPPQVDSGDFDSAIETIATSTDQAAVSAAAEQLQSGGLPAIQSLLKHLDDQRQAASRYYLARSVTGPVDVGDHCFWLIQDILETLPPKKLQYSALSKTNIATWLSARDGETLAELRRDACVGALAEILAASKANPDRDFQAAYAFYTKQLIKLDREAREERNAVDSRPLKSHPNK